MRNIAVSTAAKPKDEKLYIKESFLTFLKAFGCFALTENCQESNHEKNPEEATYPPCLQDEYMFRPW